MCVWGGGGGGGEERGCVCVSECVYTCISKKINQYSNLIINMYKYM